MCSVKRVFLEISQNSQENTFARVSFLAQVFSCEFCEISKNNFFHITPLVAASVNISLRCVWIWFCMSRNLKNYFHITKIYSFYLFYKYRTFFRIKKLFQIWVPWNAITKFFRSSRPDVFCRKDVLKIFAKFTGKHLKALCQRK